MVRSQFPDAVAQLQKQLACLVLEHEREVTQLQNHISKFFEYLDKQACLEDSQLASLKKALSSKSQGADGALDSSRSVDSLGREGTSVSWEAHFGGKLESCIEPKEEDVEDVPDVAVLKGFKTREMWTECSAVEVSMPLESENDAEFRAGVGKTRRSNIMSFVSKPHKLVQASLIVQRPGSSIRICWDLLSVLGLAFDIVFVPLQMAALVAYGTVSLSLDWFSRIFWTMDIFTSFVTGYYSQGNLIMDPLQIAKHYCRTWFFFDLLAVGTDWALFLTSANSRVARLTRIGKYLRFVRTLRIFRLQQSAFRHSADLLEQMFSDAARARFAVFKWLIFVLVVYHFIACCWYTLGTHSKDGGLSSWVDMFTTQDADEYRYITSLQWTMSFFAGTSGGVIPKNVHERLFSLIMALFSLFVLSSIVSLITSAISSMQADSFNETLQMNKLRRYFRIYELPAELCERVTKNAVHKSKVLHNRIYPQDVELLSLVSDTLRMEIMYKVWEPCFQQSTVLSSLCSSNRAMMQSMAQQAVQLNVLAQQDYAFHSNQEAESALYTLRGDLIYTPDITAIGHRFHSTLASARAVSADMQAWICEVTLWVPWVHVGDLVSSGDTDIACVVADSFGKITKRHPDVLSLLSKRALAFVDTMNDVLKSQGKTMKATFDLFGTPDLQ